MLWDDPKDSENTQRFKNLILFKFYGTNEERDQVLPVLGFIFLLLLAGFGLYALFSALTK
jgi:hypothetical protein